MAKAGIINGGLKLPEQAADPGSTGAGEGTVWVKDDAPTELRFTDDTGTDHPVTTDTTPTDHTWAFRSRGAGAGTFYWGGFYDFGATDNDFNPAATHGTADKAYGAHVFIVNALHGGGGDTTIQVSGTSITDAGVRDATPDTEILTITSGAAAGTYAETTKKWIGQVTLTKVGGNDTLCNYGFCKYWDNHDTNFTILGLEATWLAAANDAGFNIKLRHHKATGWTYNNGAPPTPPTELDSLQTDYVTEYEAAIGEEGAWKRSGFSTNVEGSGSEGTIIEVVTTAANTIELGNFSLNFRGN